MQTPKQKATGAILSYLSTVPSASRKEILDAAMRSLGIGTGKGKTNTPNPKGRYGTVRSYLGATLSELVRTGEVARGGRGYLLGDDGEIAIERAVVENKLRATLARRPYTEAELHRSVARLLGTDATQSLADDEKLALTVRELLRTMLAEGEIVRRDGCYTLVPKKRCPDGVYDEHALRIHLYELLWERGGPAFEAYVAGLLEKYYLMRGSEVLLSETTGGSEDGGIDVEVHVRDPLGFVDNILIQTKCRARNHVTEKEVREFYGALCAKQGSRGMYITTSTFHPSAENLLDSIDRIVGLDGSRLFAIILETSYGICKAKGGYRIDYDIFA